MSKRRRRRRTRQPNLPAQTIASASATESSGRGKADLAEEYAYVVADLGRIALIAAVMLVGLVALWLVLR